MAYYFVSAIIMLLASIMAMSWLFFMLGIDPVIGQILAIFLFVFFLYE